MLRKMMSARTHVDLADNEFGGNSSRWGRGFNYIVHRFDRRFESLIGPRGLRVWAPYFGQLAEVVREHVHHPKESKDANGEVNLEA